MGRIGDALKQPRVWIPLVALLIALIGAGIAGLVYGNWLVALVLGLVGSLFVLVIILLRTVVAQEREERLDRGYDEAAPDARKARGGSLKASFRESVAELRSSRLGRNGLYELPWFLVVGESGAGKSAVISASGLELPAEFAHVAHGGATLDCDWWFTNQAILLDTSGRYLDSDDDGDRREWRSLLRMLRKARPKGAINGLVVAIPAHRLLDCSTSELEERARSLRRRLNEITDGLSIDAPIYLMITKSDQIEGFIDVMNAVPPVRHQEAFGWTNTERRFADAGDVASRGLEEMRDRIELLVPELVIREGDAARQRRIVSFPHELRALSEKLAAFLRQAFAPSVYEETPFLRGVYLCTALRSGASSSAVLARLGQDWARSQQAAGPAPMFLRDVFRDIVIGDRDLALPISTLGPRARRAILATGALAVLAATATWGVAAYQIQEHQRQVARDADRVNLERSNLTALDDLRQSLVAAERVTVLNRVGLGYTLDRAVRRGREVFARYFALEYEQKAKANLSSEVTEIGSPKAFAGLAELALDLTWMRTRAEGEPEKFRPRLGRYAERIGRTEIESGKFMDCYDAYLRWAPVGDIEARIEKERRTLSSASTHLLSVQRLQRWADSIEGRAPVQYEDLGLPRASETVRDKLSGAWTRATWEAVVRPLILGVEESKGASRESIQSFKREYAQGYDRAWERFVQNVSLVPAPDPNPMESPYIRFLQRVREEVRADVPRGDRVPAWIATLEEVLREEPLEPAVEEDEEEGEKEEPPPPPWQVYSGAVNAVAGDVALAQASPEDALKIARAVAMREATTFRDAMDHIRAVVDTRSDPDMGPRLRKILQMPVLNALASVLAAAIPELDKMWRAEIANPYGGSLDEAELVELYGASSGVFQQFEANWLAPFYASGRPKTLLDSNLTMPFGPSFLAWLSGARKVERALAGDASGATQITLRMTGRPSRVIAGAGRVVASKRVLRVDCADQQLALEYRPSRAHTIRWSPLCSEVELRVWVKDLESGSEWELPSKTWRGPLAMPNFFQSADQDGDEFVWTFSDTSRNVGLTIPYVLSSGRNIMDVAHRGPPASVRN